MTAVRFRRGLIAERKAARQRLHDLVSALCSGLSAPSGQGRALDLIGVAGHAFLDCLIDLRGRPASVRSLQACAVGRLTVNEAKYWSERWKSCLPAPPDPRTRIERLTGSVNRWRQLSVVITTVEDDMERLLARTAGQVLTTLPGVKTVHAACFSAFLRPSSGLPTA